MTVAIGWVMVSIAFVVLVAGLHWLRDVGAGLVAIAGCVTVLAASQLVPPVIPRVLAIVGGEVVVGAIVGWWFARGVVSAGVLVGAALVCGALVVQLVPPSGDGGAGDAFALVGMAVVAAILWALVMVGFRAGVAARSASTAKHPADS